MREKPTPSKTTTPKQSKQSIDEGLESLVARAKSIRVAHGEGRREARKGTIWDEVQKMPVSRPERRPRTATARLLAAMKAFRDAEVELRESMDVFGLQEKPSEELLPWKKLRRASGWLVHQASWGKIWRSRKRGIKAVAKSMFDLFCNVAHALGADLLSKVIGAILIYLVYHLPTAENVGEAAGRASVGMVTQSFGLFFGTAKGLGASLGDLAILSSSALHDMPTETVAEITGSGFLGELAGTGAQLFSVWLMLCTRCSLT